MIKSNFQLSDLAIFGGPPSFNSSLHVGRPNIGDREKFTERVNDILDRRWLSNGGQYVREFEGAISSYINVKHCITVANATIALEIAVRALGLKGEVILPSFTFIATAHALQWLGVTPVFCDIDLNTLNIDPHKVEELITSRTSAIMGVHVYGRPCNYDELERIARKHDLALFYDAAHAFGCSYKGKMVGNFGDLEVFSFHATKFLNSLEGGAIVTNNDDLANRVRRMTNFGFATYDHVIELGTNGKMNEVSAAMGLSNLETIEELIGVNQRNYKHYQIGLSDIPGIQLVKFDENEKNNFQYLVLEIDKEHSGISRDDLTRVLHYENVLARRYFYPGCHRMQPYATLFPDISVRLPVTEHITEKMLCLPTGTGITPKEIEQVCMLIRSIVAHGKEISDKIS